MWELLVGDSGMHALERGRTALLELIAVRPFHPTESCNSAPNPENREMRPEGLSGVTI
jgi:hypothetical protein